jgi:hypothetical protein
MSVDLTLYVDDFDDAIHASAQGITSLVGATFPSEQWINHVYLDDNQITTLTGVTFPKHLQLIST